MTSPSQWVRPLWDRPWLWLAIVIVFFCAPLFIGLGGTDIGNDEAIYSFADEVMLKDGDWLTPKSIPSETAPFLEKPPLKFWITYVPLRLGLLADDEFGLRFMDAAMGALAFLYVFGIGRRIAGPVCGIAAVTLLFTHNALLYEHGLRSNNMESAMVLAYAAAVYHFLAWRSVNPDVKRHVYAMAFWFVVGFMTKFVAALFLPVILGAAAVLRREDLSRLKRDWKTFAAAAGVAVALILPWFIYQYVKLGAELYTVMFGAHVFKRFTVYLDPAHVQPRNFYFFRIWLDLEQAGTRILISAAALLFLAKTLARRWTEGAVVLLWFFLPIAAISTGTSKLYHYAYPFLAPVALVGGWLIAVAASRVFQWIAAPVEAATEWRDAILPAAFRRRPVVKWITAAGLAAMALSAATAVYGRVSMTIGTLAARNSSIARPAIVAGIALIAAAPQQILRGVLVLGLAIVVSPVSTYIANVQQARIVHDPMRRLRSCMRSVVDEQIAAGHEPPGTWVEIKSLSWSYFYYLRELGPWSQRDYAFSDETVLMNLVSPDSFRPVVVSSDRLRDLMVRVATDPSLIERTARKAQVDLATMLERLNDNAVGLATSDADAVLLPGPYVRCAYRTFKLTSR